MEGSGFGSVQIIYGSGCGSWILWQMQQITASAIGTGDKFISSSPRLMKKSGEIWQPA